VFCFPFVHEDGFWCRRNDSKKNFSKVNSKQLSNETNITIPSDVSELLSKGPNFRVQPALDNRFIDRFENNLDTFFYRMRWAHKADFTDNQVMIPFGRNTVTMPPKMPFDEETKLAAFKSEILEVTKLEIAQTTKNENFLKNKKVIHKTKKFLESNSLVAIPSDKTNRLVVTHEEDYNERVLLMLQDAETYEPITKSKQIQLEKQANSLIRNVTKDNYKKRDIEKLLSTGSQPASFKAFIKDHKPLTEKGYPLRPIASVTNTAAEKVDWLVSSILTRLSNIVPSNIKNSKELIDLLDSQDKSVWKDDSVFISLDVVNLYPNIPLAYGIESVINFAERHWQEIDNMGLRIDQLEKCLSFVCYNYEIRFLDKIFKQKKGCPMGAHFAPPFAIIVMDRLESEALKNLSYECNFTPLVYKRYIDDILIGPVSQAINVTNIVKCFNAVNKSIQFTAEVPQKEEFLSFLDIDIRIRKTVEYKWHIKPGHSNNSLNCNSWVPSHVKSNYLDNSVKMVAQKCSSKVFQDEALIKLEQRFLQNGFNKYKTKTKQKRRNERNVSELDKKKTALSLDFVSDSLNRKINSIIKKYNLQVRLISKPARSLKQIFKKHNDHKINKHENCAICEHLPEEFNCNDRFLVYQFTCKYCSDFYIGETSRPFYNRYKEHARSLNNGNFISALSEHASKAHKSTSPSIRSFDLEILRHCKNAVEARLAEARAITARGPPLNRKHEKE